ncbi:MAG: TerC family protein [Acidobacteriota bacterium]
MEIVSIGSFWMYAGFVAFVLVMLALDLGVFHRKAHEVRFREALSWSVVWVVLAMVFNAGVWALYGQQKGLEFLTGYLIEKSLAVDNIFVFVVLFSTFAVPPQLQHRVLFWGILGALLMRAAFIAAGAALLGSFHWLIYVFGALLIITGAKLLLKPDVHVDPTRNPLYRLFQKLVPSTPDYRGQSFLVREGGRWLATPLLAVLVAIEATDLVFAVDSIPAIFAVTRDPFIVFTSNIFAILGLRAMYFMLAGVIDRFVYLRLGLASVLMFVGAKMTLAGVVKVPTAISLAVIALLLGGSVVASLLKRPSATIPKGLAAPE